MSNTSNFKLSTLVSNFDDLLLRLPDNFYKGNYTLLEESLKANDPNNSPLSTSKTIFNQAILFNTILGKMEENGICVDNSIIYDVCCGEGNFGLYVALQYDTKIYGVDKQIMPLLRLKKQAYISGLSKEIAIKWVDITNSKIVSDVEVSEHDHAIVALNNCGSLVDYVINQVQQSNIAKMPKSIFLGPCCPDNDWLMMYRNLEQIDFAKRINVSEDNLRDAIYFAHLSASSNGFAVSKKVKNSSIYEKQIIASYIPLAHKFIEYLRVSALTKIGYDVTLIPESSLELFNLICGRLK